MIHFSVVGSLSAVMFGYYLNTTYGMAWRVFDAQTAMQDMDKRSYNERVFQFKKTSFSSQNRMKVLVVGNSFGRDFVNMTSETLNTANAEIVYRDDLSDCILPYRDALSKALFGSADVIVFASGYRKECISADIQFAQAHEKNIFYVGTKDFGYNLNWITRLAPDQRRNQYNQISEDVDTVERGLSLSVPA